VEWTENREWIGLKTGRGVDYKQGKGWTENGSGVDRKREEEWTENRERGRLKTGSGVD
jgi:hypothetical protein